MKDFDDVSQFDFQQMQETFFLYAESGLTLEYTLLTNVWAQCTLSVVVKRQRLGGGGVLSSIYNKNPKCVNAVYNAHDQKSILDR
jgi:hypothetical protein